MVSIETIQFLSEFKRCQLRQVILIVVDMVEKVRKRIKTNQKRKLFIGKYVSSSFKQTQ